MNKETAKNSDIWVNGEVVAEAMIQQELQMLRERYAQQMSPQELEEKQAKIESDARENAVERVLLLQEARQVVSALRPEEIEARLVALKAQHGGDEEFNKRFTLSVEDEERLKVDLADGIRLEKYFEELCKQAERPVEADAQTYYDAHEEEFLVPEMVHAAHLVQHPDPEHPVEKVYAELLNIRERLKNGEDFDTLAQTYSQCGNGEHDLGYFARGQMVPAFEEVAFATAVGDYSDVFQTEFGYHILIVLDHKPATCRSFKEVRYDIEGMLFEERKNEVIGAVADRLRASADIKNLEVVEG